MATRRFHVKTPDQLLALSEYAKDGNISRAASIWRTAREKKGNKATSWENNIVVDFCAYDDHRTAIVFRLGRERDTKTFAHLRYNPALQWCKEHLQEVQ